MNSASPDELALVEGAQNHGYAFKGKDGNGVISILRKRDDQILKYKLMNTLEFNSTRKRMSIIIRDLQTGAIELLCKGADSVISPRLDLTDPNISSYMESTQIYVDQYANEGLRTLLLAKKQLDEDEYEAFNHQF